MAEEVGHQPNRPYVSYAGSFHMNGANFHDAANVDLPQGATIANAASTSNVSLVTIQLVDGLGNAVVGVFAVDVWLSDAATGVGLTANTASGAVGASTSGTDLGALTAKKALRSLTDATGKYILSITDTGKNLFVPCVSIPFSGKAVPGTALTAGSYG